LLTGSDGRARWVRGAPETASADCPRELEGAIGPATSEPRKDDALNRFESSTAESKASLINNPDVACNASVVVKTLVGCQWLEIRKTDATRKASKSGSPDNKASLIDSPDVAGNTSVVANKPVPSQLLDTSKIEVEGKPSKSGAPDSKASLIDSVSVFAGWRLASKGPVS
jgi:hypothetical protein